MVRVCVEDGFRKRSGEEGRGGKGREGREVVVVVVLGLAGDGDGLVLGGVRGQE